MLRITLKSHSTICIFTRSHKRCGFHYVTGTPKMSQIWSLVYGITHIQFFIHLHKPFKRSVEFSVRFEMRVSFLSKFGWKGLMTCLIKSLFLRDYWIKSDGVFAEMQIISYNFINLSIFRSICNFERYWCWKSDYHFLTICVIEDLSSVGRQHTLTHISPIYLQRAISQEVDPDNTTNGIKGIKNYDDCEFS